MRRLVVTDDMLKAVEKTLDMYRDELLVSNRALAEAIFKALPIPKKPKKS